MIGGAIGLGLVTAAVLVVLARRDELGDAWAAMHAAPWWLGALAIGLPLANWVVVSLALWVITSKHGPVRPGEMMSLVAGAWLLNYLPMRPGMIGRIAYHRAVNGIGVKASMGLLVLSMGLTAAAIAIVAALSILLRTADGLAAEAAIVASAGLVIAVFTIGLGLGGGPWRVAAALFLRYVDMLIWVARYWVVFGLVGQSLTFEQACAIAAVSQAATAVPISGNGLGLREWAVGLTATALPSWFGSDPETGPSSMVVSVAADLVNRGVEMAVALPVGIAGILIVSKRIGRLRPAKPPESAGVRGR